MAFYTWKAASTYAILAAAMALLQLAQSSWMSFLVSACLLATFWQQAGWLAHDFLHHQVCTDRRWNRAWGYLIGNVSQVCPITSLVMQFVAGAAWRDFG